MGGAYLRSRIKQAGKWDQETIVSFFLCQYCSGEYLRYGYELGFVNLGSYDMVLVCNGDEDDPELANDPLQLEQVLKAQPVTAPTTSINFQ